MTAVDERLRGIKAVWFDVGEVLIDESREYGTWADWLGVPRHTFSAVFGAVIASGRDYREVFQYFRPGFDLEAERQARIDAGLGEYLNANDLYPDVRPCLTELRERGYFVGIAGNQTARAGRFIRELNLPADVIATSDDWGVSKPSVELLPQARRGVRACAERDPLRRRSSRQRHLAGHRRGSRHCLATPWSLGVHSRQAPRPGKRRSRGETEP